MEVVAITGGKGGVGKSTFAILLANKLRSAGKKVVLADLDVECPNDYLLLGLQLGDVKKRVYAKFPKLDKEKCTKCGLCVQKCPDNAIFQPQTKSDSGEEKKGYPVFMLELCAGCGLCWSICPVGAIEVEEKVTGEVFVDQSRKTSEVGSAEASEVEESAGLEKQIYWLVTGRSVGIVEETGPVVAEVRKYAEEFAKKVGADYLLLDTAPGLHCSVIRALWEVDKAYAVTEPTPLGAHDLKLILELLEKLEVPAKIVLNQADLGNRKLIDCIAEEFDARVEYEIPYSRKLVEMYSKGQLGNFMQSF
ncbi:MAG: P-loop NTPase [Patescibacteria group bacterium]|nr:P-loop NTPase [Patescibacteria group bacterium]